ncbi:MAG: NAD+ synthase [Candidatus Azotimanducaceae bacterium]|jgi:NAD+ synthase
MLLSKETCDHITEWLKSYALKSGMKGFVVGVSGGIDSALTSTLCALTGLPTHCVNMPILQEQNQVDRSDEQIKWLKSTFPSVSSNTVDLSDSFLSLKSDLPQEIQDDLSMANARARLRMTCLYSFAGNLKYLVAGTGNKIEDFGIGFFTKYGDGGVDLSPIADLLKTEVYALAKHLGVPQSIQNAAPTDGLWGDERNDEDQIGASYPELEWAMHFSGDMNAVTERQKEVWAIYTRLNKANQHKMHPIPVCVIPSELKI